MGTGPVNHNCIYQDEPIRFDNDHVHKPRGFTRSIEAYTNEASREVRLLSENNKLLVKQRGYGYTLTATINVHDYLSPKQVADLWKQASRKLVTLGLVAYYVREPSKSNRVHYHLVISSPQDQRETERIIADAKPKGLTWHCRVEPLRSPYTWLTYHRYILKAKVGGDVIRNGKSVWVPDIYHKDRLLFVPKMPFNKIGVIGKFYVVPKSKIWENVRATEKAIADGLKVEGVRELCDWMYETYFGGFQSMTSIERAIGLHANADYVQKWIQKKGFGSRN